MPGLVFQQLPVQVIGNATVGGVGFDSCQFRFKGQNMHTTIIKDIGKMTDCQPSALGSGRNAYQGTFFVSKTIGVFKTVYEGLENTWE